MLKGLEGDFRYTNFFVASDPPPPGSIDRPLHISNPLVFERRCDPNSLGQHDERTAAPPQGLIVRDRW